MRQWIEALRKKVFPTPPVRVDTVILGSGPFSLVRAIAERRLGRKVLIVDRQEMPGGAWAARAVYPPVAERFDVVAHLLSVYPDGYNMLRQAGFEMENRSLYFWDAAADPEKADRLARLADHAFRPISGPRGHLMGYHQYLALQKSSEGEAVALAVASANRNEFEQFSYVHHSFQPIVDRLWERYIALGGEAALGQPIESLEANARSVRLQAPGFSVLADKLIGGRHMDCRIVVNGSEMSEPMIENLYRSMLVLARFSHSIPHRYINVVGHPLVQAIQIARSASFEGDYVYSLCIVANTDHHGELDHVVAKLLDEFREAGIFQGSAEIIATHYHRYVSCSRSSAFLNEMSARCPRVEINIVDNMCACMAHHKEEWAAALG